MSRTVTPGCGNQWDNAVPQPQQLAIQFDPSLPERHRSLKECVAACAYTQRGGLTAVAGKLDMSPSHLSEVLAGGGDRGRKFDLDELERYIATYNDVTPVLYLVAKFMPEHANDTEQAAAQLRSLLQQIPALLNSVTSPKPRGRR